MDYEWPGNIRELENAIARAVIVTRGTCITTQDLPKALRQEGHVIFHRTDYLGHELLR